MQYSPRNTQKGFALGYLFVALALVGILTAAALKLSSDRTISTRTHKVSAVASQIIGQAAKIKQDVALLQGLAPNADIGITGIFPYYSWWVNSGDISAHEQNMLTDAVSGLYMPHSPAEIVENWGFIVDTASLMIPTATSTPFLTEVCSEVNRLLGGDPDVTGGEGCRTANLGAETAMVFAFFE